MLSQITDAIKAAIAHARAEIDARRSMEVICWNDLGKESARAPFLNTIELVFRKPDGQTHVIRCRYCDGGLEEAKAECLSAAVDLCAWELDRGRRGA